MLGVTKKTQVININVACERLNIILFSYIRSEFYIHTLDCHQAFVKDEFPKPALTLDTLAAMQPKFVTDGSGTVTAGNSSGK